MSVTCALVQKFRCYLMFFVATFFPFHRLLSVSIRTKGWTKRLYRRVQCRHAVRERLSSRRRPGGVRLRVDRRLPEDEVRPHDGAWARSWAARMTSKFSCRPDFIFIFVYCVKFYRSLFNLQISGKNNVILLASFSYVSVINSAETVVLQNFFRISTAQPSSPLLFRKFLCKRSYVGDRDKLSHFSVSAHKQCMCTIFRLLPGNSSCRVLQSLFYIFA